MMNLKDIFLKKNIAIDFGTANCVIMDKNNGIILSEPTVVAVSLKKKKIIAVGEEARVMLGKVPRGLVAKRPLKNGGIANFKLAQALLKKFFDKSFGRFRLIRSNVIVSTPLGISSVEERALVRALNSVGVDKIYLFPEPLAAAIGAKMPIHTSSGNLIVNLGGGTAEISVISLNGVVTYASHKGAGDAITEAIITYIKKYRNLRIGEQTAEIIKMEIASATRGFNKNIVVKGVNDSSGLPDSITITSDELVEPIKPVLTEIIDNIKKVLDQTPPELISDIYDRGIVMSGGTSLLNNLDDLITKSIGIPAYVVEDPLKCVARGLNDAIYRIDEFNLINQY